MCNCPRNKEVQVEAACDEAQCEDGTAEKELLCWRVVGLEGWSVLINW